MTTITKQWVKFLKDWTHKEGDNEEKSFKKDDIIEFDEDVAKSFLSVGLAEETEAPKDDDTASVMKEFANSVEKTVETVVSKALENVSKNLKIKLPAVAKDHEVEELRGFKTTGHFYKSVFEAGTTTTGPREFPRETRCHPPAQKTTPLRDSTQTS